MGGAIVFTWTGRRDLLLELIDLSWRVTIAAFFLALFGRFLNFIIR